LFSDITYWLWGKFVQIKLDEIVQESQVHQVRKQKNILLPSGGHQIDFYNYPENYGGKNRLIHIAPNIIDNLVVQYDKPELLLFGSNKTNMICIEIYKAIGFPKLTARMGWAVFLEMITYYIQHFNKN
jgi:hypothetical protein